MSESKSLEEQLNAINNQKTALDVIVQAVILGQKRGAWSLDESALLSKAISLFRETKSNVKMETVREENVHERETARIEIDNNTKNIEVKEDTGIIEVKEDEEDEKETEVKKKEIEIKNVKSISEVNGVISPEQLCEDLYQELIKEGATS